jgi:DNA adenine methylase
MNSKKLTPFLKWPGGKRWFITKYKEKFPTSYNQYIEPFVGGGSVFFSLQPINTIISDVNSELINVYIVMRDTPDELANILQYHQKHHCEDYYYKIRAYKPREKIKKAGRFLYLNRTCYNGMYRVNQKGVFNVPIGTKNNCIYDIELFPEYARSLKNAEIHASDFGPILQRASRNDLVFVDPPYTIAHNQNSFIKYNERLFSWEDQERLLDELCNARNKGAIIFATNANYNSLREMYVKKGFFVKTVERYSSISGKTDKRGTQEELLITSMKMED